MRVAGGRRARNRAVAAAIGLLLLASATWSRPGAVLTGDRSSLAAVKPFLLAGTLAYAWWRRPFPARLPPAVVLLGGYCATTALGAALSGDLAGGGLRSARYVLTVLALTMLVGQLELRRIVIVIEVVATGLAAVALVGLVAGVSPLREGRLYGYLPPLHPNILAGAVAVAIVVTVHRWAAQNRAGGLPPLLALPIQAVALVLTGSRTAFVACAVGCAVTLCTGNARRRGRLVLWSVACLANAALLVGFADHLDFSPREAYESGSLGDNIRSRAWSSAVELPRSTSELLLGEGLDVKVVPVVDPFHGNVQVIDSTWVSAYVEGGVLGTALLTGALIAVAVSTVRFRGTVLSGVLALLAVQSVAESTLNDVSFASAVFCCLAAAPIAQTPARAGSDRSVGRADPSAAEGSSFTVRPAGMTVVAERNRSAAAEDADDGAEGKRPAWGAARSAIAGLRRLLERARRPHP